MTRRDNESESRTRNERIRDHMEHVLEYSGMGETRVVSRDTANRVLTPTRRDLLRHLDASETISLEDLDKDLDRRTSNLVSDLRALENDEFVELREIEEQTHVVLTVETVLAEPIATPSDLPIRYNDRI